MTGPADYYVHDLSPFLIEFGGGWGIRYYGLAYALGFLGLYFGLWWQGRLGWSRLRGEAVADFVTWMIVGVVVGGRLFYCLFYGWETTVNDPLSIFRVWDGGMASHGGILGALFTVFLFARAKGIPFWNLADATALCTPPALLLGRSANFINGELWGRPTNVSWAVIFPDAPTVLAASVAWYETAGSLFVNAPRHPSQIYQALLEGALLFVVMLLMRRYSTKDGPVALMFIGGYAVARIIGECFREPDAHIGYLWTDTIGTWLTQGQLLSFFQVLLALALAWALAQARRTKA